MWIASALFAIVIGAILNYGISDTVDGVNLNNVGTIIMIAGAVGLVAALFAEAASRRRTVTRDVVGPDGRQYSEQERHTL